jgi:hypothetical protein
MEVSIGIWKRNRIKKMEQTIRIKKIRNIKRISKKISKKIRIGKINQIAILLIQARLKNK